MFFVSLRLLRAITVILCLLVRPSRHFGFNLARLNALLGTLGVSLGSLSGITWTLLGLS